MNLPEEMQKAVSLLEKSGVRYEIIEGHRCFVLPHEWFLMIFEVAEDRFMGEENHPIKEKGYDNFNLAINSGDRNAYFICCEAKPILDDIWKDHYKEPSK